MRKLTHQWKQRRKYHDWLSSWGTKHRQYDHDLIEKNTGLSWHGHNTELNHQRSLRCPHCGCPLLDWRDLKPGNYVKRRCPICKRRQRVTVDFRVGSTHRSRMFGYFPAYTTRWGG